MDKLIHEASKVTISDTTSENDFKLHAITSAITTPTQLLAALHSDIAKLSKLSVHIKLVAANRA